MFTPTHQSIFIFLTITVFSFIGLLARYIAFEKVDSVAVEVCKTSFIVNTLFSLIQSKSISDYLFSFFNTNLLLLILLLCSTGVHLAFKVICNNKIHSKMQLVEKNILSTFTRDITPEQSIQITDSIRQLYHIESIAKKTIYLCYSRHIDNYSSENKFTRSFMNLLNGGKGSSEGYKHLKTELRKELADLSNSAIEKALNIIDPSTTTYENCSYRFSEDDFNIEHNHQVLGLILFQILPILSIIIGSVY